VPYSITFASLSGKNYDVTKAYIANKFVFLDLCVRVLCNLGFAICGSYIQQHWPSCFIWFGVIKRNKHQNRN